MNKILKETQKAVMISNKGKEIWLPKSQIVISDNSVTKAAEFLIKEHNLEGIETLSKNDVSVNELTVIKVSKEKGQKGALVTYTKGDKSKTYGRKLYERKTGDLKGSYLFNFRCNIFKFSKVDTRNVAQDIQWIGSYDNDTTFEEAIKSFEGKENKEPQQKEIKKVEIDYTKPVKHKEYDTIKACIENDIPVYLTGPAGSGKNHTLKQIADDLNLEFYFTNSIQQEYKITGFIDAGGKYHETEFYKAFVNGGLFFLDEMDASIPEVLVLLNAAIANRYFEFPNGKVDAHEDFRVVSAGNTLGNGADEQYTGRLVLDQATLDRFVVIEFDYDKNIELFLAKGNTELVEYVNDLRKACQKQGIRGTFSYRCISTISKLEKALDLIKVLRIAVFKGMDIDTMKTLRDSYSKNKYWIATVKLTALMGA